MKKLFALTLLMVSIGCTVYAQDKILARDAKMHINETVTVTGKIFSGKYIASNNITLLDLGGYNPNQDLTIMISSGDRSKFEGKPEEDFKGREVTVTGKIIDYKGKPEMVIADPAQIKLVLTDSILPVQISTQH